MPKPIKIKDIPESEEILYANIVNFKDYSFIGIPNFKAVKFVITNVSVYLKITGVLIDTSGTLSFPISQIKTLSTKTPVLYKSNRFLRIGIGGSRPVQVTLTESDCQIVIDIFKSINPSILVEEIQSKK